jgi:hypothetical protein
MIQDEEPSIGTQHPANFGHELIGMIYHSDNV